MAKAEITELEILRVDSPTFDGRSFGSAGRYEKIVARAHGAVDPSDPRNAVIADIDLAPRNAAGMVEYSTDVYILKPVNMSKGSDTLFFDILNRGRKLALGYLNNVPNSNDPTTAEDAGDGLLMRLGYTIAWAGWQNEYNVSRTNDNMLIDNPIAHNPDGSSITGDAILETIFDDLTDTDISLVYPVASLDKSQARILVRNSSEGPREEVPEDAWSFVDPFTVRLDRSGPFFEGYDAGAAYEFIYEAIDPDVNGLGYAATRDVATFLRHSTSDDNPVAGDIEHALVFGASQSGRMLKGFLYWGFNETSKAGWCSRGPTRTSLARMRSR